MVQNKQTISPKSFNFNIDNMHNMKIMAKVENSPIYVSIYSVDKKYLSILTNGMAKCPKVLKDKSYSCVLDRLVDEIMSVEIIFEGTLKVKIIYQEDGENGEEKTVHYMLNM